MIDKKMKKFNIGTIKINMQSNGFAKGLVLNRELTVRECRYIMRELLGIDIQDSDCFEFSEEYKDYNTELCNDVNNWLKGDCDEHAIMNYAYDCSDEPLGMMNLIPIIVYLKKKNIIN